MANFFDYATAVLAMSGCVSYWRLTNLTDEMGLSNLTVNDEGTQIAVSGQPGAIVSDAGTSYLLPSAFNPDLIVPINQGSYLTTAASKTEYNFNYASAFTLMAWVKPYPSSLGRRGIIEHGVNASYVGNFTVNVTGGYDLWIDNDIVVLQMRANWINHPNSQYDESSIEQVRCTGGPINTHEWNFIVGVHDPTTHLLKLYINGALQSQALDNVNFVSLAMTDLASKVSLGRTLPQVGGNFSDFIAEYEYLNGYLDEVAIFSTALTGQNITKLYDIGINAYTTLGAFRVSGKMEIRQTKDKYEIYLDDKLGRPITMIDDFVNCHYVRSMNTISALTMTLQGLKYPRSMFGTDFRIRVMRCIKGTEARLDANCTWLVRGSSTEVNEAGVYITTIQAVSAMHILSGRIIDYADGTAYTNKSDKLDNIINAIVRENLGSSASNDRDISAWLTVQPDAGLGPASSQALAKRVVLAAIQECAKDSESRGTPMYFDIVSDGGVGFYFFTTINYYGVDRRQGSSANPVILSIDRGNLTKPKRISDATNESTAILGATTGNTSSVRTLKVVDLERAGVSPFGYRERLSNDGVSPDAGFAAGDGRAQLQLARPRETFEATINQTADTTYGIHWNWGDIITVQFGDEVLDVSIDTLTVAIG